eukprot:scaffold338_cov361-Pavlova_lutheri.AAC.5
MSYFPLRQASRREEVRRTFMFAIIDSFVAKNTRATLRHAIEDTSFFDEGGCHVSPTLAHHNVPLIQQMQPS